MLSIIKSSANGAISVPLKNLTWSLQKTTNGLPDTVDALNIPAMMAGLMKGFSVVLLALRPPP